MSDGNYNSTGAPNRRDRRAHVRHRPRAVSYIDLGDSNGGIVLNISETGLAIHAVTPVMEEQISRLRFQLSNSKKWIESSGRVVWLNASRKIAGVAFDSLTEEARTQIRGLIAAEAPGLQPEKIAEPAPAPPAAASLPTPAKPPARVQPTTTAQPTTARPVAQPASPPFVKTAVRVDAAASTAAAHPVASRPPAPPAVPPSVARPVAPAGPSTQHLPAPRAAHLPIQAPATGAAFGNSSPRALDARTAAHETSAAHVTAGAVSNSILTISGHSSLLPAPRPAGKDSNPIFLAMAFGFCAAIALIAGWTAGRGGLKTLLDLSDSREVSSKPTAGAAMPSPILPGKISEIEIVDSNNQRRMIPFEASRPSTKQSPRLPDNGADEDSNTPREHVSAPAAPIAKAVQAGPQTQRPSQATQPESAVTSPLGASAARLSISSASTAASASASSSAPSSASAPAVEQSKLIYRVDPVYPSAARDRGVQGTVTLHAVIGSDGAVATVQAVEGPALLASAAADAVRQWRFVPTLQNGRAVQHEENISIDFHLTPNTH